MSHRIVREDIATIAKNLGKDAKKFAGKTILMSGGSGFLGKYIVGTLLHLNDTVLKKKPCRVISIDNFITGSPHPDFNYKGRSDLLEVWADVTQPLPVREDIHYIIHGAGLASPVYYKKFPLETIESAVTGAKNLLELARKQKHIEGFLFFSSSEIYGDPDAGSVPTPETYHGYVSSVGPRACYDESKRLGETISTIYWEKFGIPAKIVRPFNVFGPGMGWADRRVLPMFAYKIIHKEPLPVHGDGVQTRTFCYITDATAGFLKVLVSGKPGEAYNIGNADNEIGMKDLAGMFSRLGKGGRVKLIPYTANYPAGEPQRRCPGLAKAKKDLGFRARVNLKDGLSRFLLWAKNDSQYKTKAKMD